MDEKAEHAVIQARTQLLLGQPFFGCLALHLDLIQVSDNETVYRIWGSKEAATMAVDGINMYYYPKFVLSLSEEELKGVVAHEVYHCALKHFSRRGLREPLLWNAAGDFVINADAIKAGFKLPGKPITLDSPPGATGYLFDPKWEGLSTEEIYERIRQKLSKKRGGGKSQLKADPSGCGVVLDVGNGSKDGKQPTPADLARAEREWDVAVRVAINTERRANAGKLPGYLERLVQAIKPPEVNWKEKTQQFIDGNMGRDYTWSRPSRRSASTGLIMPGFMPDSLHHLVMFIDVSGSVSHEMACAMVSEGAGALEQGVADRLTVAYVDTAVRHVDVYAPGDLVEARVIAGGGTDFADAFRWLMREAADASCVVFLTDMQTSDWGEEPDCPVLWGAFLPESQLESYPPPFGSVIPINSVI